MFNQIFDSSIADDYRLRQFFVDLLVLADVNGVVDMTHNAISGRTRVPIELVKEFLATLAAPDTESRTPIADGRRIILLDEHRTWGWQIVNYDRFRKTASEEQRREKTKERVDRFREKTRAKTPCNATETPRNVVVTPVNASNAMQKQSVEADAEEHTHYPECVWNDKTKPGYQGAQELVRYINHRLGTQYRETGTGLDLIADRLIEGNDVASCKVMIERQIACWKDTEFERHLTIATLFKPDKFNEYMAKRNLAPKRPNQQTPQRPLKSDVG